MSNMFNMRTSLDSNPLSISEIKELAKTKKLHQMLIHLLDPREVVMREFTRLKIPFKLEIVDMEGKFQNHQVLQY